MSLSLSFITPRLYIADYYDALINQIDIYTEKILKKYKYDEILPNDLNKQRLNQTNDKVDTDELFGVKYHQDNYSLLYNYDHIDHIERRLHVRPGVTKIREYIELVRAQQIDEIRKVQQHNLEMYELNKDSYKIDRDHQMNETELEEMKSRLFANKFCFVVNVKEFNYYIRSIFKLCTVITDFYISKTELDFITKQSETQCIFDILSEKLLVARLTYNYINGLVTKENYGSEIIKIDQNTILNIEKVDLVTNYGTDQTEINLNSDFIRLNLSVIKSLSLSGAFNETTELVGLDAFFNLEYLTLKNIKLTKSCLRGLNRLLKLNLQNCSIAESLEPLCMSNLVHLKTTNLKNAHRLLDLDLINLIRLEWLELTELVATRLRIANLNENLTVLKIQGYKIGMEKANEMFTNKKFPNLTSVNLDDNRLSALRKEWISAWTNLKHLSLRYNMIQDLDFLECESSSNLEYLELSKNNISFLHKNNFSRLVNLKRLNLSKNRILEFSPGLFSPLANLEELILSGSSNRNIIVEKTFLGLMNLKTLDLSDSVISQLDPTAFVHTPKLTKLILNPNQNFKYSF